MKTGVLHMSLYEDMKNFEQFKGDYTRSLGEIPNLMGKDDPGEQTFPAALGSLFRLHEYKNRPPSSPSINPKFTI